MSFQRGKYSRESGGFFFLCRGPVHSKEIHQPRPFPGPELQKGEQRGQLRPLRDGEHFVALDSIYPSVKMQDLSLRLLAMLWTEVSVLYAVSPIPLGTTGDPLGCGAQISQ